MSLLYRLKMKAAEYVLSHGIKKAAKSAAVALIGLLLAHGTLLAKYGVNVSFDQAILESAISSLMIGLLSWLRNYLKVKLGLKFL